MRLPIQRAMPIVRVLVWLPLVNVTPDDYHRVKRVIDGDTPPSSNGEKVRLIGMDTPEVPISNKLYRDSERSQRDVGTIQELGKKASVFTKRMTHGKKVSVE